MSRLLRDLVICHEPRVPTDLPEATRRAIVDRPVKVPRGTRRNRTVDGRDATIVVVTANALPAAKLCLEGILAHTADAEYEIQVIDNGSTDGTASYLQELVRLTSRVVATFNTESRGLVAAQNQGIALARGSTVVLLGQDCIVPPGWLPRLIAHLSDPAIGLLGPVTNRASNEAQVSARYSTYGEFVEFAAHLEPSAPLDVRTLNAFCVAMRREVREQVGSFDERFEVNVFQEEDYAIRVRNMGYRVACAPDVFVHNAGLSAIGHLTNAGLWGERFQDARRMFEEKWAVRWYAYDYFNASEFDLLRRIRAVILQAIPPEATVLVVSKGDEEILTLAPRAWHFPRTPDGSYAGHYPADSAEAIAQLETQRLQGADFLLIPNSAAWWLTYYDDWRRYLETRYHAVVQDDRTCVVFDLRRARS